MRNAAALRATFSEAIDLVNKGKADEAERICRETVEVHPDDVNMIALLGAILVKKRQYQEAESWLRKATELAPSFAKPHEDPGYALLQQARPEEAIEALQKATRLDPSLELAFLNLGKALAMVGKGKEADEAFERSFDLNPVRKKLALAAEHQKEGRYDEAGALYREVLRADPKNVDALRMLGILAFGAGNIDEAERYLRRTVALAPDFVNAVIDLGGALKEQGCIEEAIECFTQTTTLEPANVKAHYQLAQTLSPVALSLDESAWFEEELRQQEFEVHRQTLSIVLVFVNLDSWPELEFIKEPGWDRLADIAIPVMHDIIGRHYPKGGTIIRAMAAKLVAGGRIAPHTDSHQSFHMGHRIHIPITTNSRVRFMIDGRPHKLEIGKAYEINNQLNHSVANKGDEDRITFIFDYIPPDKLTELGRRQARRRAAASA